MELLNTLEWITTLKLARKQQIVGILLWLLMANLTEMYLAWCNFYPS